MIREGVKKVRAWVRAFQPHRAAGDAIAAAGFDRGLVIFGVVGNSQRPLRDIIDQLVAFLKLPPKHVSQDAEQSHGNQDSGRNSISEWMNGLRDGQADRSRGEHNRERVAEVHVALILLLRPVRAEARSIGETLQV